MLDEPATSASRFTFAGPVRVPLLRPRDAAERQLHADHEVQPTSYDGPHALDEREVAPQHPVVPHPDREVRRHVGLAAGVLDHAADGLHRPGAVVALVALAPGVRRLRGVDLARRRAAPSPPRRGSRRRRARRPSTAPPRRAPASTAMEAAVWATCALESTPVDRRDHVESGSRSGRLRLVQVEHHALADQRVEHSLGRTGERAPARRPHDVPDQHLVVGLHERVARRCRRRPRT